MIWTVSVAFLVELNKYTSVAPPYPANVVSLVLEDGPLTCNSHGAHVAHEVAIALGPWLQEVPFLLR